MKFLLIVSALNLKMAYEDHATCKMAAEEIMRANNDSAICIPLGEDAGAIQMRNVMNNFINAVRILESQAK
jgi:hypothetical protein